MGGKLKNRWEVNSKIVGGVKCVPQTGGRLEVDNPVIPSSLLHGVLKYAKSNKHSHKQYFKTNGLFKVPEKGNKAWAKAKGPWSSASSPLIYKYIFYIYSTNLFYHSRVSAHRWVTVKSE